ncbi:MAG: RNA polymerase sigma factor, partial [Gemmatimonadetes bacterium]|nr:RNA polymerase sigma factor [Gemmatimonadota bacterium]
DRAEAEDVLQSAYLKVLEGRARFDGRSSEKTWLFAVIRLTAAEHRRRRWLADLLPERLRLGTNDPEPAAGPEPSLAADHATAELKVALTKLSARQREVLHLVFYEDLSVEQAAATLGISVGSARVHYHRGKEQLRRLLETRA